MMHYARIVLLLLPLGLLLGCTIDPSIEARESLAQTSFSPKYHSGFWAAEAEKKCPLWEKAQAYCLAPEHVEAPNCRIVIAVDVTVRVVPIRPGEDPSDRVKEWVRRGSREVPPYVPGKGFGPEPPKMPKPSGR
jgi:hypothetical protein